MVKVMNIRFLSSYVVDYLQNLFEWVLHGYRSAFTKILSANILTFARIFLYGNSTPDYEKALC